VPIALRSIASPVRIAPRRRARTLDRPVTVLAVHGLRKRYRGAVQALDGVDLEVRAGELVGLLGPNGAGKSTLVKICAGLVRPSGGRAEIAGAPAGSPAALRRLGYLAELFRLPGWATADEVLALHQRLAGSDGGARERAELLALVGLEDARGRRVEAMSKGMQQRLGLAQALVGAPPLLLLDEPTSALDPVGRRMVRELLVELRRRGHAVLLSSHLLSEVELVCDRVAIVHRGRVAAAGTPAELARPRGVEVETAGGVRVFERATREEAPRIVAELVASGERMAPAAGLAGAVVVIAALSLLGSVLLSTTANGIAILMVFGAGLTAGLLGQIGEALDSATLDTISDLASWLLPFEALYQDGLARITADVAGPTAAIVDLGPFGGAQAGGPALWPYTAAYVAGVLAVAMALFTRRDL
jgi:ABC-2 type transport system ATP-binding protein